MTARKNKETQEQQMQRIMFEWVWLPVIIIVVAMAAVGFLLATLRLQNGLPTYVYGLPGFLAGAIYYILKLRKLWHKDIKPEITANVGGQVGFQHVKDGSVAPIIKTRGHNTTIIVNANTKPVEFKPAPVAAKQPPQPPTE